MRHGVQPLRGRGAVDEKKVVDPDVTVGFLRDAAASRIERTSLRGVAREIGLSPTGLKKFILGTRPYSPTLRRLRRWYIFHYTREVAPESLTYELASAAVAVLVFDLTVQVRPVAVERLLDALSHSYVRGGLEPPKWRERVRAEYDAP